MPKVIRKSRSAPKRHSKRSYRPRKRTGGNYYNPV